MEKAYNKIKAFDIAKDDYVILACSYGPDSMVLLDILKKSKKKIVIAHVNHKIRKESDDEEKKLKKYAKENNMAFESHTIIKYPKGNFESNARKIRYNFFEKVIKKYNSKYLFTAHHGDDLVETILMRIVRGASFKGYAGFEEVTRVKNYYLIRPLINYSKEDIIIYANKNNISYAIDHTNYENDYTRSRFRNNIIPFLKRENKNIHEKFLSFSKEILLYDRYFNNKANKKYKSILVNNKINLEKFTIFDEIFQKKVIKKTLLNLYDEEIIKINNKHIELIFKLINNNKKNSYIYLPLNLKVIKSYNNLIFKFQDKKQKEFCYLLQDNLKVDNGVFNILKEDIKDTSNYIIRLNSRELNLPLKIRSRLNGDKIEVLNLNGSKKVNEIFIENKLNVENRDKFPVVVDAKNNVIWLPGLKKSKFSKQNNETYDIIIKYKKKEKSNEKKNI